MAQIGLHFLLLTIILHLTSSASVQPSRLFSNEAANSYKNDSKPSVGKGGRITRPIIFMHGIFNDDKEPCFAQEYLPTKIGGVKIYPIDMYNGDWSATNLDRQLGYIIPAMKEIMDNHTDTGVTLLCYSQGGVICRAVIQMMSTHNVHTLITLSSPLAGQYGVTSYVQRYVPNKDRKYLWSFWYSWEGQEVSIGNYWNDPHHQDAFSNPKQDVLLARLNNQTGHSKSQEYKANFLKLKKLVMVGGPNDTVITPWQSAHLGFYNDKEIAQPFEKQPWYANDGFGLQTLHKSGNIIRHTYPGLDHTMWYRTPDVYDCCVIPYL